MPTLKQNQSIGLYTVAFPIRDSKNAETYRVKDRAGKNYFLKFFNLSKLHRSQFTQEGKVLEIEITRNLNHSNILHQHDSGELLLNGQQYVYAIYDFISGETAAKKTTREQRCGVYLAKKIVEGVLEGLKYLHSQPTPILHNELTIQNIMLDMEQEEKPIIVDFGNARYLGQRNILLDELNPFYQATEAFNGIFTVQTDLFQVGIMLYHLLFGLPPYYVDLSKYKDDREALVDAILLERRRPLRILNTNLYELDEQLINIIAKATASNVDDRFQSADEFLHALRGEIKVDVGLKMPTNGGTTTNSPKTGKQHGIRKGNGFADVIGMEELKEKLQNDVIDVIKNPAEAAEWGITIPNGLLFYGPPGCGKTYFAQKFAEETGMYYMEKSCSDIASPYIHGGQTAIAELFKEAREHAPTLLYLDEIEALVMDRTKHNNVSESGEVTEFLVQLNNCGHDGVLVIGATNHPMSIDKAALRSGRLELKYRIPMPNEEVRKGIFQLYLQKTKADFGIDYAELARRTENCSSVEVRHIVEEAIRYARKQKMEYVTMQVLEQIISDHKPDLPKSMLEDFETEYNKFEGKKDGGRRPIGFA